VNSLSLDEVVFSFTSPPAGRKIQGEALRTDDLHLLDCIASTVPMLRWYAIYTKGRHEKKAADALREKGVVTYLPLITKKRRWKDRKKEVAFPLFTSYVFVHLDFDAEDAAERRWTILKIDNVVRFAGETDPGQPPLSVPDQEIYNIRTVLERRMKVDPYRYSLRVGQSVRIKGGPLKGVEGVIVEKHGSRKLVLHVRLIRQAVAVEVDPGDVVV
jgi:transcription antitermination factor NusG